MPSKTSSYLPCSSSTSHLWDEISSRGAKGGVPEGYPETLNSPLAWTPEEVEETRSEWFLELQQDDLEAIEQALNAFEAKFEDLTGSLSMISPDTFPLPQMVVAHLREVSDQCYQGRGFKVVRGLNPKAYTAVQNIVIYAGLASHIAPERGFVDIHYRSVVSHVVNAAGRESHTCLEAPPGFTNSALSFHTDNCEIMGLYCIKAAAKGGTTALASSWNLYNILAAKRPDILKTLTEEWVFDTFRDYNIAPPRCRRPLNLADKDTVSLRFNRYGITGWLKERDPGLPAPTPAQIEAMDAIQCIAALNCIRIHLRTGDMIFVNDTAVMHSRDAFDEGQDLERHLIKMMLRDPSQKWPIAQTAQADLHKLYGPNHADGTRTEHWELDYHVGMEMQGLDNG